MSSSMKDKTREDMVAEFHDAMGQPLNQEMYPNLLRLRLRLLYEEMSEFRVEAEEAMSQLDKNGKVSKQTKEHMLKELCDLMYVTSGFAVTFGLPLQPAFVRVHKSNMSKLVDGKPLLRDDGKVLKGPNYKKPDLKDLV